VGRAGLDLQVVVRGFLDIVLSILRGAGAVRSLGVGRNKDRIYRLVSLRGQHREFPSRSRLPPLSLKPTKRLHVSRPFRRTSSCLVSWSRSARISSGSPAIRAI
jgi:hypothetical protein